MLHACAVGDSHSHQSQIGIVMYLPNGFDSLNELHVILLSTLYRQKECYSDRVHHF